LILDRGYHSIEELMEALDSVSFDDLVEFTDKWLVKIRFEWFFFGNI